MKRNTPIIFRNLTVLRFLYSHIVLSQSLSRLEGNYQIDSRPSHTYSDSFPSESLWITATLPFNFLKDQPSAGIPEEISRWNWNSRKIAGGSTELISERVQGEIPARTAGAIFWEILDGIPTGKQRGVPWGKTNSWRNLRRIASKNNPIEIPGKISEGTSRRILRELLEDSRQTLLKKLHQACLQEH